MIIGVDFDNTIVCYDHLFYRVAMETGLVPADVPRDKKSIRDFLRRIGQEAVWTEMQGYVYGPRIVEAEPFPGVMDFFKYCREQSIPLYIISHKTRKPIIGPDYDLHEAARSWLRKYGVLNPGNGLAPENIHFELTKEAKLSRIGQTGCTVFIDDLPEFLQEPNFPERTQKVLFDSNQVFPDLVNDFAVVSNWDEIQSAIAAQCA